MFKIRIRIASFAFALHFITLLRRTFVNWQDFDKIMNFENFPGGIISGVDGDVFKWIEEVSNERYALKK